MNRKTKKIGGSLKAYYYVVYCILMMYIKNGTQEFIRQVLVEIYRNRPPKGVIGLRFIEQR